MTDRVEDEHATIEDMRLGIMEDLISRYLLNELDLRLLTNYVTISRLHYPWGTQFTGHWLRQMTYLHLFMFTRGTWSESTLRESLEFLKVQAIEGECRWKTPMVDKQWLDLLKSGHVPPGGAFYQHTEESVRAMTPQQRADLRKTLGFDQ